MRDIDVLITGGGPVGLTASILLSRLGVSSLLVERHPCTSIHPKARGINARTMEIFRQCGVEAAVRTAGLAPERRIQRDYSGWRPGAQGGQSRLVRPDGHVAWRAAAAPGSPDQLPAALRRLLAA